MNLFTETRRMLNLNGSSIYLKSNPPTLHVWPVVISKILKNIWNMVIIWPLGIPYPLFSIRKYNWKPSNMPFLQTYPPFPIKLHFSSISLIHSEENTQRTHKYTCLALFYIPFTNDQHTCAKCPSVTFTLRVCN